MAPKKTSKTQTVPAQTAKPSAPVRAQKPKREAAASAPTPVRATRARKVVDLPEVATKSKSPAPRPVSDEDVRVRAYFLSLEHRGRGNQVDFWLLAERELRSDVSSRG